jgi:hypothetical protein
LEKELTEQRRRAEGGRAQPGEGTATTTLVDLHASDQLRVLQIELNDERERLANIQNECNRLKEESLSKVCTF